MGIRFRSPSAAEEKRKEKCLALMTEDRQQLLIRWPFLGSIIIRMDLVPVRDDRLKTICTDGNKIFADIDFYMALEKNKRVYMLAHEIWHCALLHLFRRQSRDRKLFDAASDIEVYFALKGDKFRIADVPPHDPSWEGLSAEEIYEKLVKMEPEKFSPDLHFYKNDAVPSEQELCRAQAADGEMVLDENFEPNAKSETVEQIRGRVIASAQQLERTQGKLPGAISSLLKKLQKPELPWQELLKQFVTSCYGGKRRWLPPARRHVWQGIYLPSMRDQFLRAVVAIDTSGSTYDIRKAFVSELFSLMRSFGKFELTVIQCDAAVGKVDRFTDRDPDNCEKALIIRGGGGTDFVPAFKYVEENLTPPDLFIYFTDGFGSAPQKAPSYPVLWILPERGVKPAGWGRAIYFGRK